MRRRLLSLCLVLCMMVGMIPVAALAGSQYIYIQANDEKIRFSYTDGESGLYAAEDVPSGVDLQIEYPVAEGNSFTLLNCSGSKAIQFTSYPYTLAADEIQDFILTEDEKAGLSGLPFELNDGTWALLILKSEAYPDYPDYVYLNMAAESATEFTVTLPTGDGFTVQPSEGSSSPVAAGGEFRFTVTVDEDYDSSNMVVSVNGNELTAQDGEYVLADIREDQTVTVTGVEKKAVVNVEPTVVYTGSNWPYSYYHIAQLTLSGVKVDYVEGTNIYLNASTAKNTEFTFTATAGGRYSSNLGIKWNDGSENTNTYTGRLSDGTASVKIYAYKASGAGVSRNGTKTFTLCIAEPNTLPSLAEGYTATATVDMCAGEMCGQFDQPQGRRGAVS